MIYRKQNDRQAISDRRRGHERPHAAFALRRPPRDRARHAAARRDAALSKVDVVGPVCESGDFFARNREMPAAQEGDLLAILDAGAYGMSLASNYNTRPRAAEVLVDGKRSQAHSQARDQSAISWHLSASSDLTYAPGVFSS